MKPFLITILGPTASGKTDLAIQLAKHYGTEILSADSRQLYNELTIGTAKPTANELAQVKHHFIDHLSITGDYNAGTFEREALAALDNLYKNSNTAILAGGTGLYINALLNGLDDVPKGDPQLREELTQILAEKGIDHLQLMLLERDPEFFKSMDFENPQRLIRALEVTISSGKPNGFFRTGKAKERSFQSIKIGLYSGKEQLHARIAQRVENMIAQGLEPEVRTLLPYRDKNALQTVGYSEMFEYLDGHISLDRAVELIKQNTRKYAKRQMTWFKRDAETKWFESGNLIDVVSYIETQMQR